MFKGERDFEGSGERGQLGRKVFRRENDFERERGREEREREREGQSIN